MTIDQTAVARAIGIGVRYQDFRSGSILNKPQRIGIVGQGNSAKNNTLQKLSGVGSAGEVAAAIGYGGPVHQALRQLLPANGDGVGTIPVDVYLLPDDPSGAAAVGSITPSGTQTKAAQYRARVNNILSRAFAVAAGASVSDRCKAVGEAINSVLEMPVAATYTYGTVTSSPGTNTGNGTVTVLSAPGQPVPGVYTLRANTKVTNGGVFSLIGPDGAVIAADITMTPGPGGTTVIDRAGLQFTLTDGSTDFEVNDSFAITVPATVVTLTAKWKGRSSNALRVAIEGESLGTAWGLVQPTGGLVNPDVQQALNLVGAAKNTLFINCLEIEDTTALDAYQTFGEGRWGLTQKEPCIVFTGNTHPTVPAATAVSSTRRTDRINSQLVNPGSDDLPVVVAARQVARIAVMANNNPPTGYASLRATGLTLGPDSVQWDHTKRDQAVKLGSSTIENRDGVVALSDIVTFYRPDSEEPPAYRHVVDIIKVMNVIYNIDLEFAKPEWASAPLVPDEQTVTNEKARKPSAAKTALAGILDNLALAAIISDPTAAKKQLAANISPSNPKRLDARVKFQISGNTDIIDIDLAFGFYFGTQAAA